MRFYRIHNYHAANGSQGFAYFTRRDEAERKAREITRDDPEHYQIEVEEIDVTPTKAGILAALEMYASHPDNG